MGIQDTGSARWCEHCGEQFIAYSPRGKYCSDKCKQAYHRAKKSGQRNSSGKLKRTCAHCGKRFDSTRSDAIFCKPSCRIVSNRKRQAETARLLMRHELGSFGDFYFEAAERGWKPLYRRCEVYGYTWIPSKEQYWQTGMAEACRLI